MGDFLISTLTRVNGGWLTQFRWKLQVLVVKCAVQGLGMI